MTSKDHPSGSAAAFYEEQVFPLTTNTNCYSAYNPDGRWATQRHVCWTDSDGTVQWEELPTGRLCVGYTSVFPWEAVALLHDHWQPEQDTVPVAAVDTTTAANEAVPNATSSNALDTMEATISTSDDGLLSRSQSLVGPIHVPSEIDFSSNNSMPELNLAVLEQATTATTAEVMVRQIHTTNVSYTIPIPYRPVALHMMLPQQSVSPLVWMGSADHSKLHSYELQEGAFQLRHDEEFPASVLAITTATCSANSTWIIVASQDGSVVTLKYNATDGSLTKQATMIIDGPILALRCRENVVTIGSLCGYVAQMKNGTLSMLVEGLVIAHSNQEDAVLAVEATDERIWVGTRSGRCLAYRQVDDVWTLDWHVQLPYAINGILQDTKRDRIIVTTTRGVHIFRSLMNAVQQARERLKKLQSKY